MKYGVIQRNGVASSSHATMTEHFIRHGDYLTLVSIVTDPAYLEEPFIRTSHWVRSSSITPDQRFIFEVVDEVAGHPRGYVPHYPFGTIQDGFSKKWGIPLEAAMGGVNRPDAASRDEYVKLLAEQAATSKTSAK